MRFLSRSLGNRYVYPCSKADVKTAFGDESLDSASFGLSHEFHLEARYSPRPKIVGAVILALAAPRAEDTWFPNEYNRSSLYIYRVPKEEFNELAHTAVTDLMNGPMRRWLDSKTSRSQTEIFGLDELLVEFRNGQLLLHETTFR